MILKQTVLVEYLAGVSALIGNTGQESVKILEVCMGVIMEVGQQPGQCQYFLQGPGEGPEEAAE